MSSEAHLRVLREGEDKARPFTIAIVANPVLEVARDSGHFVTDPLAHDESAFDAATAYIEKALFGRLYDQAEVFLGTPGIADKVRVVTLRIAKPATDPENALVAQDDVSRLLVARRSAFIPFLERFGQRADIVYAISKSETHRRSSAWPASDDDDGPGERFDLDGTTLHHRHESLVPGTIALHAEACSLTALHEFGHALSSFSNGLITDLYLDGPAAMNNRHGRPIPSAFAAYEGTTFATDRIRDGIGYPVSWRSYHSQLHSPGYPAIMDNYWLAHDGIPERCQHDRITRRFLLDRVRAKLAR